MKKFIIVLLCLLLIGLSACGKDPTVVTDTTAPEETGSEEETSAEDGTGEAVKETYSLESEEGGYLLTFSLDADAGLAVEEQKGESPSLTVTDETTGNAVKLAVSTSEEPDGYDAQKTAALENGGKELSVGNYNGYVSFDGKEAVLKLADAPDGKLVFLLDITSVSGENGIDKVFEDTVIGEFLSSMVFNINI